MTTGSVLGVPFTADPGDKISLGTGAESAGVSPVLGSVCSSGGAVAEEDNEVVAIEDLCAGMRGADDRDRHVTWPIPMAIHLRHKNPEQVRQANPF